MLFAYTALATEKIKHLFELPCRFILRTPPMSGGRVLRAG
jgi:hypothetical protein